MWGFAAAQPALAAGHPPWSALQWFVVVVAAILAVAILVALFFGVLNDLDNCGAILAAVVLYAFGLWLVWDWWFRDWFDRLH